MPTPTEYAYLAGVLDSDGYLFGGAGSRSFGARVTVVDEVLIDWLYATFGGQRTVQGRTASGKIRHVWQLQAQDSLREVLVAILPFLVIKRRQTQALIDLIDHLQSIRRYDVPTKKLSSAGEGKAERDQRRAARVKWRIRADELRLAVKAARIADRPEGKTPP